MSLQTNKERIFGLDILRTIAIVTVVISHSSFKHIQSLPFVRLPDGVDLFFVLSGYLIGRIILEQIQEKPITFKLLSNFVIRRWFRTLPNYFLFLLIHIVLVYFGLIAGTINKYLITYFVFFQNFYKHYDFIYWESWSLAVEEWFYILLPIVLFIFVRLFKTTSRTTLFFTICLFILVPLFIRINNHSDDLVFDLYVRKLVITRLDTIGYGLLAAYISFYAAEFWNRFKHISFALGCLLLFSITYFDFQSSYFQNTFYFSVLGSSILLLFPKLTEKREEKIPFKPFAFMSKISFSMYLIHLPLIQISAKLFEVHSPSKAYLLYFLFWIILTVLSFLVYRYFERPILHFRDRYFH